MSNMRKMGAIARTAAIPALVAEILRLLQQGMEAGLQRTFPERRFVRDEALIWPVVRSRSEFDLAYNGIGTVVTDIKCAIDDAADAFGTAYDRIKTFAYDAEVGDAPTYDAVVDYRDKNGSPALLTCEEVQQAQWGFERNMQAAVAHVAHMLVTGRQALSSVRLLHLCPRHEYDGDGGVQVGGYSDAEIARLKAELEKACQQRDRAYDKLRKLGAGEGGPEEGEGSEEGDDDKAAPTGARRGAGGRRPRAQRQAE